VGGGDRCVAHHHHLVHAAIDLRAGQVPSALGPLPDVGQDLSACFLAQGSHVHPGALAPEIVEAVEHLAGDEGGHLLDDGACAGKELRSPLDRGADLRIERHADSGLHHDADPQAFDVDG
jgi:hypothetical protein